jgi:hypothetical protein
MACQNIPKIIVQHHTWRFCKGGGIAGDVTNQPGMHQPLIASKWNYSFYPISISKVKQTAS